MLNQTNLSQVSIQPTLLKALTQIEQIIVGKPTQIRLAVCCLLSGGHCLIEDMPGVGKTTLAQTIAQTFGLAFKRIQFTSDLLPADILGVSIFDPKTQVFNFHPGPVFSNCILADEMNRATPKTQSALLEAMEEQQITVEGQTRKLDDPFFVIGTQNPLDQAGTFPLPESQLDRFMMKLKLGYPDPKAERQLLSGESRYKLLKTLPPVMNINDVLKLQGNIEAVHISDSLLDYVQHLINATRDNSRFVYGLSPRAALSLLKAARAWGYIAGRDYVEPADIKQVFSAVSGHRLVVTEHSSKNASMQINDLLDNIAIP